MNYSCSDWYHPILIVIYFIFSGHFLGNNTVIDRLRAKGFDVDHTHPEAEITK